MGKSKSKIKSLSGPKLIRILFPEIQVIDHIKENGMINKEYFKKNKKVLNNNIMNTKGKIGEKVVSNKDKISSFNEQLVSNMSSDSKNIKASKTVNINNTKLNTNKEELDKVFNLVENTLSDYVLGQKEYLSKLAIAFKRPFVYGNKNGVSNTIFVTGPKGSGRHLSIKAITKFLKEEKIIKKNGVYSIDLSKYKLEKDADNLFLSDLYNALYGSEQVVVFDNFEKCHQSVLDLLSKLVIDEKIKLNRRYMDQLGQMVDVTGKGNLTLNTTDEILANGKYLVFITEKNEEYIKNTFSNNFMKKINDIISTEELTRESLSIIWKFILNKYKTKKKKN